MISRREVPDNPAAASGLARDPALVPLSRDHHGVLVQALALRRTKGQGAAERRTVVQEFLDVFSREILGHMDDEEAVLLPRTRAIDPRGADRILEEHAELRRLAETLRVAAEAGESPADLTLELGSVLHDHVRFEERAFFETVQKGLSAAEMEELGRALAEHRSLRGGPEPACPLARR